MTASPGATMQAAVWYGPRDLRIEDRPVPAPGPDEILIEVARNGICGSDLHTYLGSETGGAAMHVPGVVLGHEFSGTVRSVGANVEDLEMGACVAIAPIEYCSHCWSCRHGHTNMCRHLALYGGYRKPLDGGLAGYAVVSRRAAYLVPDGLGVAEAALAEPVAVAVHAVRRAARTLGASVLILGGGPIGLAVLQALRAGGAAPIIVSEPSPIRREAAARLGAGTVIDPTSDDLPSAIRDLTRHGVDLVFDTTAVHHAINQGIRALAPHGTLVSVAGWQEQARLDMGVAMAKEIEIRFALTYQPEKDFPIALDLLSSGGVDASGLISDHIPLARVVDLGLEELLHHNDRHIKILVDPSA
jgi:(R,R)-butanediol dehydrogenase / meso-butanediol dehydrogenase / diacetyl reductase